MNKKQRKMLIRIIISIIILIVLHFIPSNGIVRFLLYMIPYFVIGYDILKKAFKGIIKGRVFDENFLMAIATVGAIAVGLLGEGDYIEAVAVMLFYQIGELFQSYAVSKSRKNITELMDIRPDYANVEKNGNYEKVDPSLVNIGDIILVKPGEKIPIDGIVVNGKSMLNTSALTGESVPREVNENENVISGCINLNGTLKIKTTATFGESTVSKILDLVENATSRKSKSEDFISKFAKIYTPTVCILALILAFIPPLTLTIIGKDVNLLNWIYRALTFLVISCPCALVISIPLSFFAGIGGASKEGILIKGSNYMETLSNTSTMVFDKTGTLTEGVFSVREVNPNGIDKEELLKIASHAEVFSSHPIAESIKNEYGIDRIDEQLVQNVEEISGHGIKAIIENKEVLIGNNKLMNSNNIEFKSCDKVGTILYIAINKKYSGYILISDKIKEASFKAINELKKNGIKKIIMLTGDRKEVALDVSKKLKIDETYFELLPQDKVSKVDELLKNKKENEKITFAGDGINDAPVLALSDIGIAMGAMGSDAAIEAADVVLMDDNPLKIAKAIKISRKCLRIVKENIIFAITIKVICLLLGALGIANMWAAIFADVGVMIIAVLNAIRALK